MSNLKRQSLFEMPRRIPLPDNEFGLKNTAHNKKIANSIMLNKNAVVLEEFTYHRKLYKYKNKFALIDTDNAVLLYYMRYQNQYIKYLQAEVTSEVLLWKNRSQYLVGLTNITSRVFFEYLLPINGIIMTDTLHTEPGELFWLKRIEEALSKKLYVYYINLLPVDQNTNREIVRINDILDILYLSGDNVMKNPWGNEEKYEASRILISINELSG